ncbi:hypothetical protein GUITHDRAFT_151216 [Guillardia theta CCMP2712]|uniref:Uncharacterized protein n=3 Tax=Guillardia theta TaxID=55529 RepID=L1JQC2_GUITC|nr:hypothetical protein GUITHDRAFT_151216 [Guillardia theta CCMP2712]EKX50667.1 hypothetical protein GUITHDRAFT_151216 [Guillardia theta CCMP2712]|eukprot:XP_005837647.1 hypothetical protein GUITHDRAFT_151216 [Guillardia theta CCMP2712]
MSFQMSFILGFATSFMLITACVVFAPRFPSHVNPAFKAFNILYTLAKADGNDEKIAGKEPREDLKAMQIQDLEARNSALEAKLQHEKAAVENLQRLLEEMRQRNDQSRMERDQSARDLTSQALDLHYTKQELEEMRSKVQQLEQLSVQWQAEMEAAEKKIYKVTREKAAAEKAAEVLEEEVNAVRGRLKDMERANQRATNSPQLSRARGYEERARERLDLKQLAVGDEERLFSAFDASKSPALSSTKSPPRPGLYFGSETGGGSSTAETSPADGRYFPGRYFSSTSQAIGEQRSPFCRSTSSDMMLQHLGEPLGLPTSMGGDLEGEGRMQRICYAGDEPCQTRARGRRGGRKQKKSMTPDSSGGRGELESSMDTTDDLATSMALAALEETP